MKTQLSFETLSHRNRAFAFVLALASFAFAFEGAGEGPAITVGREGGSIRLSWPVTAPGYSVQELNSFSHGHWEAVTGEIVPTGETFNMLAPLAGEARFFRLAKPSGMALIPAGAFEMGDSLNDTSLDSSIERPVHTVYVSAFYMDRTEVTKAMWDEVYQWAIANGYSFEHGALGKAANHPAQSMTWYDAVKWCNARSEKEGRVPAYYTSAAQTVVYRTGQIDVQNDWVNWSSGYRLPTEAEWEKAARGGASGQRFPWGNTITHSQANYDSHSNYSYDVSSTRNFHPSFQSGGYPYTNPVGYFEPNGYGLYDMAGNVGEWCWDRWDGSYYSSSPGIDPRGPASGSSRVRRGGTWNNYAILCRTACRSGIWPDYRISREGFRSVLPPGQ